VRHQQEVHSSDATMSTAVYKDIKSINALAAICKPRTESKRAAGEAHPTDKLTDETLIGEETLFVDEVPTAAKASECRRCGEFELNELASAKESATGNETISDDQGFEDATSYKSSDDNRILGEKQGDGRTFYPIRRTVAVKMNLYGSRRRI
jgi:hypothetical protein